MGLKMRRVFRHTCCIFAFSICLKRLAAGSDMLLVAPVARACPADCPDDDCCDDEEATVSFGDMARDGGEMAGGGGSTRGQANTVPNLSRDSRNERNQISQPAPFVSAKSHHHPLLLSPTSHPTPTMVSSTVFRRYSSHDFPSFLPSPPPAAAASFVTSSVSRLILHMASRAHQIQTTSCYGMPSYLALVSTLFPSSHASSTKHIARSVETPFEDGTFKLCLTFDESYPNKPPTVKFLSRMFHPNVYANGELCLDILQNR